MDLLLQVLEDTDALYYLMIPFISGVVGWGTNALGINMMFRPLEFVGIRPVFGWQGIVPARARKFALLQMEQVERLVDIGEVLDRIDSKEIADILLPELRQLVEEVMHDVGMQYSSVYWENLPYFVKKRLYAAAARELPEEIESLVNDIKLNHYNLIDAKAIVVNKLDNEKHLLVDLIQKTINHELKFLVKSGFVFGLIFGVIQMCLFYAWPQAGWMLPVGGFLVGYLTNWIAIKLMFRPLEPVDIGGYRLQGLFIKRKDQVARDYAETLTQSVFNAQTLADYIIHSDADSPLNKLIRFHIKKTMDRSLGNSKYIMLMSIGTEKYINFRSRFIDTMVGNGVPVPVQKSIEHTQKSIDLGRIIESRMKAFTPQELDGFVRPVFEQDEWILYVVGGALGCIAGWCQLVTLFS